MMKNKRFDGRLGLAPELWTMYISGKEKMGFNL
jgi:hypothetical protein